MLAQAISPKGGGVAQEGVDLRGELGHNLRQFTAVALPCFFGFVSSMRLFFGVDLTRFQ